VVPKLPACVLPELPEGCCLIHSLSLATLSIIFSSVFASVLAISSRPQDIKLLLLFSYPKTTLPCHRRKLNAFDTVLLLIKPCLLLFLSFLCSRRFANNLIICSSLQFPGAGKKSQVSAFNIIQVLLFLFFKHKCLICPFQIFKYVACFSNS